MQAMLGARLNLAAFKSTQGLSDANLVSLGDFNGDGQFSATDMQPMFSYLDAGGGLQVVPEPATAALLSLGGALLAFAAARGKY